MDFKLTNSNALELLEILKKFGVKTKVIAVTGLDGVELILNLLRAGVNGIVYKLDGYREIRKTIEKVIEGESYFSQKVLNIIQQNSHRLTDFPPVTLNFTEKEILTWIAKGLTTKEIAHSMKMSEATTETYRVRLMKKVNVLNTASLIAYAFRNGIL
jgi:DNA-binding NarL/FixJ family response regulator